MTTEDISAVSLFRKFQPKYREITWGHLGLNANRISFLPENLNMLTWYDAPSINLEAAQVAFDLSYDPSIKGGPISQLYAPCWDAIMAGPFAGRKFYADPLDDRQVEKYFNNPTYREGALAIKLSHDGDEIPGLTLEVDISAQHWTWFIPEDTKEGKAIVTACLLEQRRRDDAERIKRMTTQPSIEELGSSLETMIASTM